MFGSKPQRDWPKAEDKLLDPFLIRNIPRRREEAVRQKGTSRLRPREDHKSEGRLLCMRTRSFRRSIRPTRTNVLYCCARVRIDSSRFWDRAAADRGVAVVRRVNASRLGRRLLGAIERLTQMAEISQDAVVGSFGRDTHSDRRRLASLPPVACQPRSCNNEAHI